MSVCLCVCAPMYLCEREKNLVPREQNNGETLVVFYHLLWRNISFKNCNTNEPERKIGMFTQYRERKIILGSVENLNQLSHQCYEIVDHVLLVIYLEFYDSKNGKNYILCFAQIIPTK